MHLIPLDQIIYYNMSLVSYSDLLSVVLLAFAYHPSYSNILYLFYGNTYMPAAGELYGSLHMLVRDSDSGDFLQNSTISHDYHCRIKCEIKVTQSLLLIQSEDRVGIYPLNGNKTFIVTPIFFNRKLDINQISDINRLSDINGNKFVIANNSFCTFGSYDGQARALTTYNYRINLFTVDMLFVGLSNDQFFGVVNSSKITFVFYNCVSCIFSGSVPNNTEINMNNTFSVVTNISTSSAFRLYQGSTLYDSNLSNSKIYWAFTSGSSWRFHISTNMHYLLQINTNNSQPSSAANQEFFITFGPDYLITFRSFEYAPSLEQFTSYDYYGNYYGRMGYYYFFLKASISSDSEIFAAQDAYMSWTVQQYQLVDSCSDYNTSVNNHSTFYCICNQYASDGKCVYLTSTVQATTSLPIAVVIAVIAGIIFIVVSVFLIKKNYKKCTKGSRRIPYKYNPAQLMSFQI